MIGAAKIRTAMETHKILCGEYKIWCYKIYTRPHINSWVLCTLYICGLWRLCRRCSLRLRWVFRQFISSTTLWTTTTTELRNNNTIFVRFIFGLSFGLLFGELCVAKASSCLSDRNWLPVSVLSFDFIMLQILFRFRWISIHIHICTSNLYYTTLVRMRFICEIVNVIFPDTSNTEPITIRQISFRLPKFNGILPIDSRAA